MLADKCATFGIKTSNKYMPKVAKGFKILKMFFFSKFNLKYFLPYSMSWYHDKLSVYDKHPRAGHNTQHLDIKLWLIK